MQWDANTILSTFTAICLPLSSIFLPFESSNDTISTECFI